MRRLPWHTAVRADRRALLTALAVAAGAAFATASLSAPFAIQAEAVDAQGPLARRSPIWWGPELEHPTVLRDGATLVRSIWIETDTGAILVVAMEGQLAPHVAPREFRPAGDDERPTALRLGDLTLTQGDVFESEFVPWTAIIVAPKTFGLVQGIGETAYLVAETDEAPVPGLARALAPSADSFLRASTAEMARDLLLVVAFCTALVIVYIYEFIRAEIRERRREIGIWRGLGMPRSAVLMLLVGRAVVISGAGAVVGVAAAWSALYAASSAGGIDVLHPALPGPTVSLLLASFAAGGFLGGIMPAWSASRRDVADLLEARV